MNDKAHAGNGVDGSNPPDDTTGGGGKNFTPVELLAMKIGWNPDHDPDSGREFVDAETYILNTKKYQDTTVDTLNAVKRQNEQLTVGMQHLQNMHKKSIEIERRRIDDQIAQIKAKRDAAIEDANKDQVAAFDSEIQTLQNDKAELEKLPAQPAGKDGDFETLSKQWMAENPWYGNDKVMTDYVDAQSDRFRGLPNNLYFKKLTDAAKDVFPEKFDQQQTTQNSDNTTATRKQAVVGNQTRQSPPGDTKKTFNDLNSEQKRMALFFERNNVMTRQEYVDEQVKIGNL